MKATETLIQTKFLKLLNKYKIDEINVDKLCEAVNIKRQTFYYHYKNIYDVIYSIFYSKRLETTNPKVYDQIILDYLNFLFSDDVFYREINESNAKEVLIEFSVSFLYRSMLVYLSKYKLSTEIKKEISRFVSTSIAQQALYYYANPDLNKKEIKQRLSLFINEKYIEDVIYNYMKANI